MDMAALKEFVAPYYQDKDIMHDLSHKFTIYTDCSTGC